MLSEVTLFEPSTIQVASSTNVFGECLSVYVCIRLSGGVEGGGHVWTSYKVHINIGDTKAAAQLALLVQTHGAAVRSSIRY